MKLRLTLAAVAAALLCISAAVLAAEKVSLGDLLKDPKAYDGKTVSTTGIVDEFKQKTSRKGNRYFVLKLKASEKDPNRELISVYSQGEADAGVKNGVKVGVVGVFRAEKKVVDFTVKNEIEATRVQGKENGVKVLK